MAYGPNQQYPTGNFTADFILRAASPVGKVATVDVFDATTQQVLAVKDVFASDHSGGDIWKKVELSFPVTHSGNSIEFRIWWYGNSNMDAAAIRVH